MAKIRKIKSSETDTFNKTLNHSLLMCSNVLGNNNKFYSLEIQEDPSKNEYRLFSHYGRLSGDVVSGGVFELREGYTNLQSAEKDFNSIVKKKENGKTVKKNGETYREKYSKIDIVSSNVGSNNVRNKNNLIVKNKIKTDIFNIFGKKEQSILKMLEEENIHDITSSTSITFDKGGLQTPLGPLTYNHISKAKTVLTAINDELNSNIINDKILKDLNNNYLSLVPRFLGRNINNDSLILNGNKVLQEFDLINQMETALKMSELKETDNNENSIGFNISIAPKKIQEEIIRQVNATRRHSNFNSNKVKCVYQIENFEERKRYEEYSDIILKDKDKYQSEHRLNYQEVDLFHGSKNSNILSILMNGIYIPPKNSKIVTARMFGNGVYGADVSTKSLNYSVGNWNRNGINNRYKSFFCLLCRFSLGRVYEASRALYNGVPTGYNSIYAEGGYDLANNEYIVKDNKQTTINYLIEFE